MSEAGCAAAGDAVHLVGRSVARAVAAAGVVNHSCFLFCMCFSRHGALEQAQTVLLHHVCTFRTSFNQSAMCNKRDDDDDDDDDAYQC